MASKIEICYFATISLLICAVVFTQVSSVSIPIQGSNDETMDRPISAEIRGRDIGRQFGGQGFPGGAGFPGGQGQGTTEEEGDEEPTSPGPGALGILSGLFGIFSGVGGLNPNKVLESTINFYPPHLKEKAQAEVDRLLGRTTKKPRANTTVIIYIERDANGSTVKSAPVLSTTPLPSTQASTTDEDEEEDYNRSD